MRRHEGEIPPASLCEVTDHGMGPRLGDSRKYGYFHSIPIAVSYVLNTQEKQEKIGLCCLVVSEQLVKAKTTGCWAASDLSQEPGPEEMTIFKARVTSFCKPGPYHPIFPEIKKHCPTPESVWGTARFKLLIIFKRSYLGLRASRHRFLNVCLWFPVKARRQHRSPGAGCKS